MIQSHSYQEQHAAQLHDIASALPKNASETLRSFVRQFYAKVPVTDVGRWVPQEAVALASSAFEFMRSRPSDKPKIRIFTPQQKRDGYEGKYSVIEVLNDDMPFLVDSLSMELSRQGFNIRETVHPIFKVERDKKGQLTGLGGQGKTESLIHFEVTALLDEAAKEQLIADLENALNYIRASVKDWRAITAKVEERLKKLSKAASHFDAATIDEVHDFLRWLLDRNFIFLGYAEYDFFDTQGRDTFHVVSGSALGILRLDQQEAPRGLEALAPELRHFLLVPQLVEITKSNRRSPVHRSVPMDYIGLKRFDTKGNVIGEVRFLGLFTSNVYYQSADMIPLVRRKIADVLKRSDFDPVSHDGKSLKAILEFLPRDEIFQMSDDDLFEISMGILALEAKPGVRVFVRRDAFERFVSSMVFVPRERFSTELRYEIQAALEKAFAGTTTSFATQITDAPLARLHLIVKTTPGEIPAVNLAGIESEIARRAYLWSDQLADALRRIHGDQKGESWQRTYGKAFPQNYINRYDASAAVHDIGKIEEAIAAGSLSLELFQSKSEAAPFFHLKIYNPNEEIALSDILPMLENAGFRAIEEHPFLIMPAAGAQVWIRDFKLKLADNVTVALETIKPLIEEALLNVWRGEMENDKFNALVTRAGLHWRQVVVLRAYAKYLKQIGVPDSQPAIEQAFLQYPQIAHALIALFLARFAPELKNRESRQKEMADAIEQHLADVSNAAHDRILRRYSEVIKATLRTNYFQTLTNGAHKPVLSFKFDSGAVPELPLPKPYAEIFVYGTRVEGIHLRGGKVARGGLRWSDRPEDFRTEILGLMKAQMVKNSVIVPVGSKGGFIVKRPPASRDEFLKEGIECYKSYLRGLLDITDNIVSGKVVAPKQMVRHDGDDPYLVVAADKGTASFSDIANSVSAEYGFWLGDAFASGGSAGYDHKKMAITARGAWISVERHFREMGVDIDKQDFTVTGIGDMAGDVFGNGMLLSNRLRLIAAFNHLHIFIDPTPDAASSFKERQRMFDLPRSSWKDYDTKLISKGGGIFERSAKTIALSKEAQTALGITRGTLTPDELIKAILLAPVDLLWNGGIGTYVKAEEETHEQVGDRANNALRVNGKDLRCKVVGEGGNLGFTQRGRIEYARLGGRINTDAIDNSAGVDCSDHEVNIKIAFSHEVASGKLTIAKRDKLLVAMTGDVAHLVLKDNILQTQAITVAEQQSALLLESHERLIQRLEKQKLLDRTIEFLPTDKQIADLKATKKGLARPAIAVLLSYSKMALYRELLDSPLPDAPYFVADLKRYFPKAMQQEFDNAIRRHPLRREIIATVVTNSLVNRAGISFAFDLAEDLSVSLRDVASAYSLVRDAFGLRALWKEIETLDGKIDVAAQVAMLSAIHQFMERATVWLLRNLPVPLDIERIMKEITPGLAEIEKQKDKLHSDTTRKAAAQFLEQLAEQKVPQKLAEKIAGLEVMASSFDIIAVSHKSGLDVTQVGSVYFALGAQLRLGWLRICLSRIAAASYWDRLAIQSMIGDLYDEQRRLTIEAVECGLEKWEAKHRNELERFDGFIEELKSSDTRDLPRLMVALRQVRELGTK